MEEVSQDKREKNTSYQPETHVRNANSREIFKNNRLKEEIRQEKNNELTKRDSEQTKKNN